ncbi:MAG TPA: hypothetical protein VFU55_11615 [Terracidiphilus sp.]|nr:hypothetical protein [Terracidiphilus sp.]
MILREVAHARAGDKGNRVTISLVACQQEHYAWLEEYVTAARVGEYFADIVDGPVQRFLLPQLGALNFVLCRKGSQTVTHSLALDAHGKCLASALLAMEIPAALPSSRMDA